MTHQDDSDRVLPIALVYFAAALLERCEALLVRISKPETVIEEIEAFRQAALQHISVKPEKPPTGLRGSADAVAVATGYVNEVCDGWLAADRA